MADAINPTFEFDEAAETYTVRFQYQAETYRYYTVVVDAYNGSILDLYWVVDE